METGKGKILGSFAALTLGLDQRLVQVFDGLNVLVAIRANEARALKRADCIGTR